MGLLLQETAFAHVKKKEYRDFFLYASYCNPYNGKKSSISWIQRWFLIKLVMCSFGAKSVKVVHIFLIIPSYWFTFKISQHIYFIHARIMCFPQATFKHAIHTRALDIPPLWYNCTATNKYGNDTGLTANREKPCMLLLGFPLIKAQFFSLAPLKMLGKIIYKIETIHDTSAFGLVFFGGAYT